MTPNLKAVVTYFLNDLFLKIGLSMHFELVRYMYISKPETFTALEIKNHKTDIDEYKLGLH